MLLEEAIKEFKKLYRKNFGEEISEHEALEKATRLLNLYRAVYGPGLINGNPQGFVYKKDER